ncbi:MAG: hypothetical protein EXS03_07640 [Phycisphaerales bacterium]|nr:hypothetical protein [Phycisphaerales bacterium]
MARDDSRPVDRIPDHEPSPKPHFLAVPRLRFQNEYVWFLFLSACDIMLTWFILVRRGGEEINPVAGLTIDRWGLWGAIALKFSLVLFVVVACEWIARERIVVARRLAWTAIGISSLPVVYSLALLTYHWAYPIEV